MDMTQEQEISFNKGYALAQIAYDHLSVLPQTSDEWVSFFHQVKEGQNDLYWIDGIAAFITKEEIKGVNLGQLNKHLKELDKTADQYGDDSRWVDRLLQCPPARGQRGPALEIPADLRPDYVFDSFYYGEGRGKLGRIYMQEVGMHMYLPHCDVFDVDEPTAAICIGDQLYETSTKISELLTVMQKLLDPEKKNLGLQQAIDRCITFESGTASLPQLLRSHNIGVVHLAHNSWHRVNYQDIHADSLYLTLEENNHIQVTLEPSPWLNDDGNPFDATDAGFDLSGFIKEAINRIATKK